MKPEHVASDDTKLGLRLLSLVTRACADFDLLRVVGEGVETTAERDTLVELGYVDWLTGRLSVAGAR